MSEFNTRFPKRCKFFFFEPDEKDYCFNEQNLIEPKNP
jgi:hypothetical protein